ncbi:MAG: hypothetical protein H7Y32_01775 [Chloroflexales bacterium]|nr:hypothetical protein [Chloroflexales bacterium]
MLLIVGVGLALAQQARAAFVPIVQWVGTAPVITAVTQVITALVGITVVVTVIVRTTNTPTSSHQPTRLTTNTPTPSHQPITSTSTRIATNTPTDDGMT